MALACSTLEKMTAQYRGLDVAGVRAVATAAVRDAHNQAEFVERASEAAGVPVEIITGREESRLIHLGVQSRWPHSGSRVLIVDIGGGSAEMISSDHGHMRDAVSKPLGAVRLKEIFISANPAAVWELRRMREYIEQRVSGSARRFGIPYWDRVVATSATASAIVCMVNRIPRSKRELADRKKATTAQIRRLAKELGAMNLAARRKVTGIGPSRAEIIVPGAFVLLSILTEFGANSVYYSLAGVRDGIVADLAARGVGRELSELGKEQRREVERVAGKFAVDLKHARHVMCLARHLFAGLQSLHKLPPGTGRLLEAATYLIDVGHYVNDSGHHKHSYYLVANSDLPGFTAREREVLANLCRYHRKATPAASHPAFQALSAEEKRTVAFLMPLLRLGDALDRGHDQRVSRIHLQPESGRVVLSLEGEGDLDLEQWAAGQVGPIFESTYGVRLAVERKRRSSSGAA